MATKEELKKFLVDNEVLTVREADERSFNELQSMASELRKLERESELKDDPEKGTDPNSSESGEGDDPKKGTDQVPEEPETVLHQGAKTRPPTEEEIMNHQARKSGDTDRSDADRSIDLIEKIQSLRKDGRRWGELSTFQRYALVGAQAVLCEMTDHKLEGRTVTLAQAIGFNPTSRRRS